MLSRRKALVSLGSSLLFAPAIVSATSLMKIKPTRELITGKIYYRLSDYEQWKYCDKNMLVSALDKVNLLLLDIHNKRIAEEPMGIPYHNAI